ncbi:AI-2E family transporter [Metabacillus iocasae]|uniref:PurR-regulated permease PerM n=1 Tax=Priestia iocasae TaxID=2291674 RepID=A0ABS2QPT3_9BACI|nr:AI-2E family transporter [Metabacillus iocasae]MBM7701420.1 putative PurR-regulated permease PerM [Metabacillus iocasae]
MREVSFRWFYRLGIVLLVLLCIFVFFKIQFLWLPFVGMVFKAISPFLIAAFITYLLHPIIEKIHENGLPRPLAILIIYLFFFGGIGYGIYKGFPLFLAQLKDLNEQLPQLTTLYKEWMTEIHERTSTLPNGVHERIEEGIDDLERAVDSLVTRLMEGVKSLLNAFIVIVIIPFIVFYMLKDVTLIKKAAAFLTPPKWHEPGKRFLHDVNESLGNYIRGQFFVCLIIGGIATLVLWLFHVPYALLLGTIIGITNVIPYFGPIIGAIPGAIIAATISTKLVIIVLCVVFSLQFLEGNVLSPLIVGKSLHIHPLFIMFALLLGGELGGIIGLILAVPILSVLKVSILHLRTDVFKH